jgi:hypothetical protein
MDRANDRVKTTNVFVFSRKQVARPERFELPTLWFEARCSIQLSYGRVAYNRISLRRLYRLSQRATAVLRFDCAQICAHLAAPSHPKLRSRTDERIGSTLRYYCVQRFARASRHHSRIHPDALERCGARSKARMGGPVSDHSLRPLSRPSCGCQRPRFGNESDRRCKEIPRLPSEGLPFGQ